MDVERSIYDRIPALSCTVLKKWLNLGSVPSEFAYWMEHRWTEPTSEAKLLGSALDCLLLEDKLEAKFAVVPENAPPKPSIRQRNAKRPSPESIASIAWWDAFNEEAKGKQILTSAQHEIVFHMETALKQAGCVEGVFENCEKAVLVGELFGFPCKTELDLWNERIPHIMDLKSAMDVSPAGFAAAFLKLGYVDQATFYLLLAQACGFTDKKIFSFIAVKNDEPWTVKVHNFAPFEDPDHFLLFDASRIRLARAAKELSSRLESTDFADSQDWNLIEVPEWVIRQAKLQTLFAAAA